MLKNPLTPYESRTISRALRVMERHLVQSDVLLTRLVDVHQYLRLRLSALECEVFFVLFLDARHALIEAREMFRGTLTQTAVYPREVARAALLLNASAVILAHNHPSGNLEASTADRQLTEALRVTLATVEVRVLDHIITAGHSTLSFAERGWL